MLQVSGLEWALLGYSIELQNFNCHLMSITSQCSMASAWEESSFNTETGKQEFQAESGRDLDAEETG